MRSAPISIIPSPTLARSQRPAIITIRSVGKIGTGPREDLEHFISKTSIHDRLIPRSTLFTAGNQFGFHYSIQRSIIRCNSPRISIYSSRRRLIGARSARVILSNRSVALENSPISTRDSFQSQNGQSSPKLRRTQLTQVLKAWLALRPQQAWQAPLHRNTRSECCPAHPAR